MVTILDVPDPSVALSLCQGELLNTKIMTWVDIFQLTNMSARTELQKPKGEASTFRDVLRTTDSDD